jgi:uncharacterized protein
MKAFAIDAFDFGRLKEQREGELPLAELPRLAQECADAQGSLHWSVAGCTHESGQFQLLVKVAGTVQLVCQRCLKPFGFDIDSTSTLILAKDEAQADQLEQMLDDDSLDVIVGSRTMDLRDLVEDEALLAIPQAPKHAQCPSAPARAAHPESAPQDEAIVVKPSPFAVLKNLKH